MNEQARIESQTEASSESAKVPGDTSDTFLEDLIQKVVHGFVSSLQNDLPDMWQSFNEVLQIIQPYSSLIEGNAQLMHYVERTYHHVCEKPDCGLDLNALVLAFPQKISKLQDDCTSAINRKVKFPSGIQDLEAGIGLPTKKIREKKGISVPKGAVISPPEEIFDDNVVNIKHVFPSNKLNINDLRKSLPFVVYEIGLREASWGRPLGITATALNTDLAEMLPGVVSPRTPGLHLIDEISPTNKKRVQDKKDAREEKAVKRPLTGREIVERFVKGHFLGSTKFAYLNRAESKHYDPYNLIVVPRKKMNPEHFVVSSHAILHVIPNRPSELVPLNEWYKEALLFNATLKFNFFKNFLIAKMFLRWKRVKKVSQFRALCDLVSKSMITCTPGFGSALLRIYSLVVDLDQVQLLPLSDRRCRPLRDFNNVTIKLLNDAQECLKMFYSYCLSVINKTKENCFEYLEYCKEQLSKKPRKPRGQSIFVTKERKAIKLQNMKHAHHEILQMEKFIQLVEQILVTKLLTLARRNICTFVNDVLDCMVIKDQGLFEVALEFNKTDHLVLNPGYAMLQGSLFFSLESVLRILCQTAEVLEAGFMPDDGENVERENSPASSSEKSDSKRPDSKSPNMLQNFLIGQSPIMSAPATSLPRLSIYDRTTHNTPIARPLYSPKAPEKEDERITNLKSLLEESFMQESLAFPEKTEEQRPESAERCIEPTGGLFVQGKTMQLRVGALTSPLSKKKLEGVVFRDEEILQAIRKEEEIVNDAIEEVVDFCCRHEWVVEVHRFVRTWNNTILASWRGRPTETIEKQLAQIKAWIEEMNKFTVSFCTTNGLLMVDCNGIRDSIIPKLDAIFRQLSKMVTKDLLWMSKDFTNEVNALVEQLSHRSNDLKAFAEFMSLQKATKEKVAALQKKVDYIKSLFEMIRSSQRQLTREEEIAEDTTWSSWENFLLCLQESSDYLLIKTPQILGDLEENIMSVEHQARVIGEKATKGEYLIPENNPTLILSQLRQIRQRFRSFLNKLDELLKCREVICARAFDKSNLLELLRNIDVRYELWKYYDVSGHTIRDWLQMPFRKMNVKKVTEKIGEWQLAADNLKPALPIDDEVFESWVNKMESFMKDFPLLQLLSNDALKPRHWKALFVGMGQQYDPAWHFTIADLYSFKLGLHKELINSICSGAVKEYALELELRSLAKKWTEKDFKLAKHFARTRTPPESELNSVLSRNSSRKSARSRQNQTRLVDMYILAGNEDLKCLIEDNRVTFQLMLVSPYVADLTQTVEGWMKNLEQLEEILDLWVACQRKWLYLSMEFDENIGAYEKTVLCRFEEVDRRFKEFMHSVGRDSKVLSVLAKKRGGKGYRELQGEALRSMLFSLLKEEEDLLKSVSHKMEKIREDFPRLYFLSDDEVLDVLITSNDPRKLMPVVRKCFHGIQSITFSLPDEGAKPNTALDAALNAHLLQVTGIEGEFGETMALSEAIPAGMDSQTWLKALEKSMKTTLMMNFTKCLINTWSRTEDDTVVSDFVEKGQLEESAVTDEVRDAGTTAAAHQKEEIPFLLRYPSQCIRCVEAVVWSNKVSHALVCEDQSDLKALCMFTSRQVEDYGKVLSVKNSRNLKTVARLRPILQSLLVCVLHQRDVVERLLACNAACSHCFEWQSCLQHEASLKQVFDTRYCTGLPGTYNTESSQDTISLDMKYEFEGYDVAILGSRFPYEFEYLSERASLFVSPLTERCFLALALALDQYSCGTLIGFNGSGKTETIRELAKLMGRHLVFYNCSQSMASSVVKRMLTGMILSGTWVCFEDAHKLSQLMLSILGDYLGSVRQAYQCLMMNTNNQYLVRGQSKKNHGENATKEPSNKERSNSVTTLDSLTQQESVSNTFKNEARENSVKKSTTISRRFSICESRNIDVRTYYGDMQPLPVSIPVTEIEPNSDCKAISDKEEDTILIKQPSDHSLGSIVFNGSLLKTHSMAACFMTVTPDNDGYLNVPENLKASLRTVSMMKPSVNKLLEVLLLCNGFSDVKNLAEKIMFFTQVIYDELPSEHQIGPNILKAAIVMAGNKLERDQNLTEPSKDEAVQQKEEIPDQPSQDEMRSIASSVSLLEEFENRTKEESAIVYGLFSVLCPKLDDESKTLVCGKIDAIFTHTVLTSATQTDAECVAEAVREQLGAESLQPNMDLVSKVIQLYQVLQINHAVIILGLSGTGKTTIYKTLCKAINSLNTQFASRVSEKGESRATEKTKYPKVNLTVLFPRAMSESELFGRIDPATNSWTDGILVKCARNAQAVKNASESLSSKSKHEQVRDLTTRSGYHRWIVLDGPLDHGCVDQMNSLLDDGRSLSLASGEIVPFSEAINFLLEVDDLQNAAPTTVSRCGIVYCPDDTVGWKSMFKSWLKGAHATWNISIRGLGIISSLMDHCVEKTLTFLSDHCTRSLYSNYNDKQMCVGSARGVHEIQRLLTILSSLFDKYILRDNDETLDILDHLNNQQYSRSSSSSEAGSGRSSSIPAHDANTVISSFMYAYIWAFGGDLHENCAEAFDEFSKALLSSGPHPHSSLPPVTVFDYHLDFPTGTLLSSTDKLSGKPRVIASSYVVVPRDEVYFSLLDILLSANKSVLLVGHPGCGKSSFMQNLVNSRYKYVRLPLAHGMSTQFLQEVIESKVQGSRRRESVGNNLVMSSPNTRNVFFLDDMNMAATDGTNNQPSAELVRSLISLGGLYDRQRLCLKPLANTCIVGAAVPPGSPGVGGGVSSFAISPRLARIMTVLSFHALSTATLQSIYCNLVQTWLEDFPAYSLTHHHQLAKAISISTISLFEKLSDDLRPTPIHPHYIFTQHDMARVFQGMMILSSKTKTRPRAKARKKENTKQKTSKETGGILNQSHEDVERKNIQEENKIHEEKSCPVVVKKDTLVSINSKTPALATPLIRVILRLWCHECTRVFSDRLIGEDKLWFSSTLHSVALEHFCETSLDSSSEGTDIVVFRRPATPKTPKGTPAAISTPSDGDDDNHTNIETTEHANGTISSPAGNINQGHQPAPEDGGEADKSQLPVAAGDDSRDCECPDSHPRVSQSNNQKAESESAITDESSTDELDFIPQEEPEPRATLSKQRVVTFEDMSKQHAYRGPLITSDQLIEAGEDLSKIIFCRHFTSSVKQGGVEQERGYGEVSVTDLTEGLEHAQELFNQQDGLPLDLVFFEKAVRHAARLSRSLCLSSGNVLLLSKSGHGRKDLVLLTSFTAGCKLIQLRRNKHEDSRQRMKSAIYVAGLQGKQVVLYVPQNIDRKTMQDVCSLMSEGNCPEIYSTNELAAICNELIPGILRGRRNDNMYVAQERFFRRVRANLHVIVCLDYPSDQPGIVHTFPFSQFSEFPSLLTRTCCIDVFQPWHDSSLTKVSILRLASQHVDAAVQEIIESCKSSVAAIMSYVHTSSVKVLEQQFGFNRYKCYTPKTFVEFVDIFAKCCDLIWEEEQDKIATCEQALAKVREANEQINEMQKDLDSFTPILRTAEQEVKDCLQLVEGLQTEYSEGREKCKQQESEIEKMTAPIAELERLAKIELDRVSPVFRSAYDALRALNVYDVEEIRSYRTPPDQVVLVVNAVCLLFGKDETWEEGKVLFSHEDFIKDLEFFNMKAITDKTFHRLKDYVENPKFVPEAVKEGSLAAMSICVWIRAVYHFCVVYREYFPKQQRVIEAKKILDEAVVYLGDLRVRCNEIKAEVEAKIEDYKEKIHHARSIEKQIQITEQRKSRAEALIHSMSSHVNSWQERLRVCQYHMKTLIGDALLTAACICYLGPLEQERREQLLYEWKTICQEKTEEDDDGDDDTTFTANAQSSVNTRCKSTSASFPVGIHHVPCRSDFNLKEILSSKEELYTWRNSGLSVNSRAVENALIMRTVCDEASGHWPLLIDTDLQSYAWVKCFREKRANEGGRSSTVTEANETDENCVLEEEVQLLSPDSPCLTTPGQSTRDSDEEFSTNCEESDSTVLTSNQSSRRTSTGACSGLLIREDLARDLNIVTSPLDDTSIDSTSTDFEFDDEEIMIISATDRHRDVKICKAVSTGATMLLIDIERKKLGPKFDNLLARNTFIEKNGKQKIQIGSRCVDYHPAFRLYLYTNIPLELTTEETMSSLFTKCLVINMALSCEGLQEDLLDEVLALERPEYETERRSLEADIYHHEHQIKIAENAVFERVINMNERLLENSEMSQALRHCEELCSAARQQLEESMALQEISKEKQEDYAHVSEHGAAIMLIVSRLSKLHCYYQTPLRVSLKFIREVVNQRRRGKRSSGSSLARSAELITYITKAVCSKIAKSVYSDHYDVFTFLVAVEKLQLAGQISEEEWSLFCEVKPLSSTDDHSSDASVDDIIPEWIDSEIWKEVTHLDTLPGFQGLKEAILSNSALWKEYFELPPILMAPTPSNIRQLSVFQRALLWKTFKKEKLHMICEDLVLYQLGTNATTIPSFSIDNVYQDSSCITPIVFFLPQSLYKQNWRKQNLKDPIDEVVALAKRLRQDDNLRIISLVEEHQASAASVILRTACQRGSWVVIKNCHLTTQWPADVLDIFHQITLNGSKEHITSKHGLFEPDTTPYTVTSCVYEESLVMHPQFRLWFITVPEIGTPLPAVIVRCGIKLAWDDKLKYEANARQSFLTLWNKHAHSDKSFKQLQSNDVQAEPLSKYLAPLAIFHSILHERCKYGSRGFNVPYHWSDRDLLWGYQAACLLHSSVLCACTKTTCPSSALVQNISVLYGGQVLNMLDWETIVALAETHFALPKSEVTKPNEVDVLLSSSPISVNMNDLGLNECVKSERGVHASKQLTANFSVAFGSTFNSTFCFKPVPYFKELLSVFNDIKSGVHAEQDIPTTNQTDESSFQMFLKKEIQNYVILLDSIISQLEEVVLGLEGGISFTSSMHEVAKAVSKDIVPNSWSRYSSVSPILAKWICSLKQKIGAIGQYRRCEVNKPLTLDIGAFLNKNSLFHALMSDWSRSRGILLHKIEITSELTQDHSTMSTPATDGVQIAGFVLHNGSWNETKGCLEELKTAGNQRIPSLLLRPCEKGETFSAKTTSKNRPYQFDCPVYFYDNLPGRFEPIIPLSYVTLSSSLPTHVCRQRQVFLTGSNI